MKTLKYILIVSILAFTQCTSYINEEKSPEKLKTVNILEKALKESLSLYKYYDNCASQAYKENYNEIGKFFDQLALSNKVHSVILKDNLKQFGIVEDDEISTYQIGTTADNIKDATEKLKTSQAFYKESIKTAEEENQSSPRITFYWIFDTQEKYLKTVKTFAEVTNRK